LDEFLFGSARASLQRVKSPLLEARGGSCFYCGLRASGSGTDVDHFIAWSRHADNGLHNLVAAHTDCNNAKRDSLAGTEHLARWLNRLAAGRGEHPVLMEVSEELRWPADPVRGIGSARAALKGASTRQELSLNRSPAPPSSWLSRGLPVPSGRPGVSVGPVV